MLSLKIFFQKGWRRKITNFFFDITSENLIKETTILSDNTREVGIYISGCIAKKIKNRFEDCCIEHAVGEIKEDDADSGYLKIISRGGLTVPSYSLSNYVCETFALLDYFNEIINKSDIPARTAREYTLINMFDSNQSISCLNHERKIQLFVNQVISNIFLNNKRQKEAFDRFCLSWCYKILQKKTARKIIIVLRKGSCIFSFFFFCICLAGLIILLIKKK